MPPWDSITFLLCFDGFCLIWCHLSCTWDLEYRHYSWVRLQCNFFPQLYLIMFRNRMLLKGIWQTSLPPHPFDYGYFFLLKYNWPTTLYFYTLQNDQCDQCNYFLPYTTFLQYYWLCSPCYVFPPGRWLIYFPTGSIYLHSWRNTSWLGLHQFSLSTAKFLSSKYSW